jgi:hypothetical protein
LDNLEAEFVPHFSIFIGGLDETTTSDDSYSGVRFGVVGVVVE